MIDSFFEYVHLTTGRHIIMFCGKKRRLTFLVMFEQQLWETDWFIY